MYIERSLAPWQKHAEWITPQEESDPTFGFYQQHERLIAKLVEFTNRPVRSSDALPYTQRDVTYHQGLDDTYLAGVGAVLATLLLDGILKVDTSSGSPLFKGDTGDYSADAPWNDDEFRNGLVTRTRPVFAYRLSWGGTLLVILRAGLISAF